MRQTRLQKLQNDIQALDLALARETNPVLRESYRILLKWIQQKYSQHLRYLERKANKSKSNA